MGKLRVHELAKAMGLPNQELLEKLNKAGMSVKTHSSTVDEAEAMKALSAGQEKPTAAETRRTVVRRAAAPEVAPPPPPEPPPPPVRPAAVVRAAEKPVEPANEPAVEAVAAAAVPLVVESAPVAAVVDTALVEPAAVVAAAVAVPAEAADKAASPQNVMRVIDAETIKARLAGEGRVLGPSGPRRAGPGRGPIARDVRVINDRFGGPKMVDVTQQTPGGAPGAPGAPGAARPGARRDRDDDRRDKRGAQRDIWFNPGEKKRSGKKGKQTEVTQAAAHKRVVEMNNLISVGDLAHQMAIKGGQVIQKLFSMGMMVTVNQTIDFDTASLVATEFGFEVKNVAFEEQDLLTTAAAKEDGKGDATGRPPVITIMGHVDHGKPSLLDRIRNADVVAGEAGGITQHIGAYSVETPRGVITFLDTPGHAAFTAMRARGAQVTDIVVLVVAADDGVMPQTIEALNHAKAAKVPIIVAINKADKPDAKPERVMQQLTEYDLVPEDWGGETMMLPVSARRGDGVDKMLESILLQAELLDLKAVKEARGEGTIIEAELDKGRGPVATVLVQTGTLRNGDYIVAGEHSGKVRAMMDSRGNLLKEAGPSTPVQVLGLSGVPNAGDRLNAVPDEKTARTVAEHRQQKAREEALKKANSPMSNLLEFIGKQAGAEEQHELKIIVKADVGGSVEAISQALEKLTTKKVKVHVVHSGVGTITESDVHLANASKAMVVGFNSKPDAKAAAVAQHEGVDVRSFSIIYELLDDVKKAMTHMLAPKVEERYLGRAEVRQLFSVPKLGVIAGSYVTDGKIARSERVRVKRGTQVVHEGNLASLKRFKDDAREVAAGYECGIGFVSFTEAQAGDIVECFELVEVAADLGEAIAPDAAALTAGRPVQAGASA